MREKPRVGFGGGCGGAGEPSKQRQAAVMDPVSPSSPTSKSDHDFEFAFNSSNFSDRILRIEILPDQPDLDPGGDGCGHRKRRRGDSKKVKGGEIDTSVCVLTIDQPRLEDRETYETYGGEPVAMSEESPSGDESSQSNDLPSSMDCSHALKVKSIYISSAILAAKSPFFFKLFSNGMLESDQRYATLRINASEEAALMELLGFIYSGKLSTTSPTLVLDILMTADKFEVSSCMKYCSQLLRRMPMTTESALMYLELPSSVSVAATVQPLTVVAKEFLANKYKDISKFQEEIMSLPLAGMEAIISSSDLQVASEDAVYDLVLRWARTHYPKLEERREMLGSRLFRLIRFPHMSLRKLKKLLAITDLDHALASKLVTDALFFKADAPHRQRAHASNESTCGRFAQRAYKYRPLRVMEFERPHQQCIVYLDLKREECEKLFPSGRLYSQAFHLGGQGFFLSGHCNIDQQTSYNCFGLFLGMQEKGSVSFTVEYEFAVRTRAASEFVSKYKGYYTFTGGKAVGYRNLFGIPWTSFIADDSLYFINDFLHLKAELTIKQHPVP